MQRDLVVRDQDAAADAVLPLWAASGARLLRLEGFTAVGKTALADAIQSRLQLRVISTDLFKIAEEDRPYPELLDLNAVYSEAERILSGASRVIFEGVCLEEVLPSTRFGRGFRVYLKRVSVPGRGNALWYDGDDLEKPDSYDPLAIVAYHRHYLPHLKADLVLATAFEDGAFDRWRDD